jgi:hypothetical protein
MGLAEDIAELAGEVSALRSRVSMIVSALTVSVFGITFLDNPIGFVKAIVTRYVVDVALRGGGLLGGTIADLYGIATGALLDAGGAVGDGFGSVGGALLDLVGSLNQLVVSVASGAGPLAPILVVLLWSGVGIALAIVGRVALNGLKWLT